MTIDASIPLDIKPTNPMQPIAGMLNIASGVQNMQAQRLQMQGQQQANTNAGIALGERQNLRQVMADPSQYTAPDGSIDYNKALPLILKAAPTTGMDVVKNMMATQQQATQAHSAIMNMNEQQRTILGKVAMSMQGQPADVVEGTLNALAKQNPTMASIIPTFQQGLQHWRASGGQPAVDAALNRFAQSVMTPPEQQAMNTPQGVPISNNIQTGLLNVKPGVEGVAQGAMVPGSVQTQMVPLGQQQGAITDRFGNVVVQHKDAYGNVTGITPMPTGAGTNGAPAPTATLPPGETNQTLKQVQDIRIAANQAARNVPEQQFNENQIIKLASETDTGKGAQILAGLKGQYAGLPWSSNSADNYNRLGHFMALETAQLSQQAGLGSTDAGRAIAQQEAGNQEWTPGAIKSTARVNRALSTGASLFNQGVENAIAADGGNPFAARSFQNAWSQTATIQALQLYDAMKNGDKEGLAEDVKQLGGVNSPQYKRTLQQIDAMGKLIRGR